MSRFEVIWCLSPKHNGRDGFAGRSSSCLGNWHRRICCREWWTCEYSGRIPGNLQPKLNLRCFYHSGWISSWATALRSAFPSFPTTANLWCTAKLPNISYFWVSNFINSWVLTFHPWHDSRLILETWEILMTQSLPWIDWLILGKSSRRNER